MTSTSAEALKKSKLNKPKTNEEILLGFQKLRSEQRFLTNKLNELELELHEHKYVKIRLDENIPDRFKNKTNAFQIVIDTLKDLDGSRKCFRMIGGILCERTVKDVLPILKTNEENLIKVLESLNQQLIAKGTEINKYKDEHNVKFKHVDELSQVSENENKSTSSGATSAGSGGGVLVA